MFWTKSWKVCWTFFQLEQTQALTSNMSLPPPLIFPPLSPYHLIQPVPSPHLSPSCFFLSFNTRKLVTMAPWRNCRSVPDLWYWMVPLCWGNASQSATLFSAARPALYWKLSSHPALLNLSSPAPSSDMTGMFNYTRHCCFSGITL